MCFNFTNCYRYFTAIIANQPFIKGKRIFGVIFLLPWAVPAFITILTFSNMFNDSIGAINTQVIPLLSKVLPFLNNTLIPWKTDPTWTKVALIMMQGWLGFPYIYVLTLGILQSIPNDLYEAAYIDGANGWQKFRSITFPMIMAVAAPTLISQYTFNLITSPSFTCLTMGTWFCRRKRRIYRYLDLMDLQVDNQFFSSIFNGCSGNLDYLCDCDLNLYGCLQETTCI